eukprot:scaffold215721_cov46-Cyclotella_meneghiniana.AAC.1
MIQSQPQIRLKHTLALAGRSPLVSTITSTKRAALVLESGGSGTRTTTSSKTKGTVVVLISISTDSGRRS